MIKIRIDDVGSSTKKYNQHVKSFAFCSLFDFWPLHSFWPFKGWGPYQELTLKEWQAILSFFEKKSIKPIIAVTACFVERNGKLVPFGEKFPEQAQFLKQAFKQGKIEIANHGLTHCIVGEHRPRLVGSNRKYHREFWSFLPKEWHESHILKSQEILESFFEKKIETFVPPGNVWSLATYEALKRTGIKRVIANRYMQDTEEEMKGIEFVDDKEDFLVLHDRDFKLNLKKTLKTCSQVNCKKE